LNSSAVSLFLRISSIHGCLGASIVFPAAMYSKIFRGEYDFIGPVEGV